MYLLYLLLASSLDNILVIDLDNGTINKKIEETYRHSCDNMSADYSTTVRNRTKEFILYYFLLILVITIFIGVYDYLKGTHFSIYLCVSMVIALIVFCSIYLCIHLGIKVYRSLIN